MPTKATLLKIIRGSSGVPASVLSKAAVVLDCDVHRSTAGDWKSLQNYAKKRRGDSEEVKKERAFVHRAIQTVRARRRQAALRPYWGKALISANFQVEHSFFSIFVELKTQRVVFWEERRFHPSGRVTTRHSKQVRGGK